MKYYLIANPYLSDKEDETIGLSLDGDWVIKNRKGEVVLLDTRSIHPGFLPLLEFDFNYIKSYIEENMKKRNIQVSPNFEYFFKFILINGINHAYWSEKVAEHILTYQPPPEYIYEIIVNLVLNKCLSQNVRMSLLRLLRKRPFQGLNQVPAITSDNLMDFIRFKTSASIKIKGEVSVGWIFERENSLCLLNRFNGDIFCVSSELFEDIYKQYKDKFGVF